MENTAKVPSLDRPPPKVAQPKARSKLVSSLSYLAVESDVDLRGFSHIETDSAATSRPPDSSTLGHQTTALKDQPIGYYRLP